MTVFQWHLKKDYIYNIWITYVRNENTKTWYLKFNALWQSSVKRYLLTEDCCKAWNFKYQILVFSFLTYIIISLFPPIDMVIEHSFMNYSYTAKIYIHFKGFQTKKTTDLKLKFHAKTAAIFSQMNKTLNLQYHDIFCIIWHHIKVFAKYVHQKWVYPVIWWATRKVKPARFLETVILYEAFCGNF